MCRFKRQLELNIITILFLLIVRRIEELRLRDWTITDLET